MMHHRELVSVTSTIKFSVFLKRRVKIHHCTAASKTTSFFDGRMVDQTNSSQRKLKSLKGTPKTHLLIPGRQEPPLLWWKFI
jgi:hypothetical protein